MLTPYYSCITIDNLHVISAPFSAKLAYIILAVNMLAYKILEYTTILAYKILAYKYFYLLHELLC